jgi:hypothetical protein
MREKREERREDKTREERENGREKAGEKRRETTTDQLAWAFHSSPSSGISLRMGHRLLRTC